MKLKKYSFTVFAIFDDIHVVHARWIPSGFNSSRTSFTGMHTFVRNAPHFTTFHMWTYCWAYFYFIRYIGIMKDSFLFILVFVNEDDVMDN